MLSEPQAAAISVLTLGTGIGVAAACLAVGVLGRYWSSIMVAPAMLVPHAMTFFWANRRIQQLDGDLVAIRTAKRALMPDDKPTQMVVAHHTLLPGETLSLREIRGNRVDINSQGSSTLNVTYGI